jgi:hypothetical protein
MAIVVLARLIMIPGLFCIRLGLFRSLQIDAQLFHTLPQGDGNARPTLARGEIGGERNLIVLDAGDVLNDGFAVRSPGINAEGEVMWSWNSRREQQGEEG